MSGRKRQGEAEGSEKLSEICFGLQLSTSKTASNLASASTKSCSFHAKLHTSSSFGERETKVLTVLHLEGKTFGRFSKKNKAPNWINRITHPPSSRRKLFSNSKHLGRRKENAIFRKGSSQTSRGFFKKFPNYTQNMS